jgi:hypothetical protein
VDKLERKAGLEWLNQVPAEQARDPEFKPQYLRERERERERDKEGRTGKNATSGLGQRLQLEETILRKNSTYHLSPEKLRQPYQIPGYKSKEGFNVA